jgi:hypothetical protein
MMTRATLTQQMRRKVYRNIMMKRRNRMRIMRRKTKNMEKRNMKKKEKISHTVSTDFHSKIRKLTC